MTTIPSPTPARWQLISTAPRDGTPILVGCAWTKSIRWAVWSQGMWRDGHAEAGGHRCGCPVPTHWLPLPAPPPVKPHPLTNPLIRAAV